MKANTCNHNNITHTLIYHKNMHIITIYIYIKQTQTQRQTQHNIHIDKHKYDA